MIRRNLLGQFYTLAVFIWLLLIFFAVVRFFDFSSDWADGEPLSSTALLMVKVGVFLIAATTLIYSAHGQVISKAKKYSGFGVFLLFCVWFAIALMFLVVFFDDFFTSELEGFGAKQQLAVFGLGMAVFAGTWLYTMIKFPEFKDVEYIRDFIEQEVERAVYKPDLSCGQCGEGLKEDWEFCPTCGGLVLGEDSLMVSPMEILEDQKIPEARQKKRGLMGRFKKKDKAPSRDELILDEEPELDDEPDDDLPEDEDFIDEFQEKEEKPKKKEEKKGDDDEVTRAKCEKCSTLLEIRNTKRPLNIRCPTCKHIWLLEE
jgi:hypothetical protein